MGTIIEDLRQHIVGVLIAIAFGAWSLALWGTQTAVNNYLENQTLIESRLISIEKLLAEERANRERDLEVIRERQNTNTAARLDMEMRLRQLEKHGD